MQNINLDEPVINQSFTILGGLLQGDLVVRLFAIKISPLTETDCAEAFRLLRNWLFGLFLIALIIWCGVAVLSPHCARLVVDYRVMALPTSDVLPNLF